MTAKVQLSYRPDSPKVGEKVEIEARSLVGLAGVKLSVRQPSGDRRFPSR